MEFNRLYARKQRVSNSLVIGQTIEFFIFTERMYYEAIEETDFNTFNSWFGSSRMKVFTPLLF